MQSEYARQYEELWRRHWWWRARERFVLRQVERLTRERPRGRILDIGCGNGLFFEQLQRFGEVRGIESDPQLVPADSPWRERIGVRPFDAGYEPEGPLDLVLMLDVLEHIADDRAAVGRVAEILAPGGLFLVTVPAMMWLWSRHDVVNQHHRRYTKRTLRAVLEGAGLRVRTVRYFFGWTVGPMVLRRMLSPAAGEGEYAVRVPGRVVNGAMYGVSRAEQMVLPWVPVGSSVLAVAERTSAEC